MKAWRASSSFRKEKSEGARNYTLMLVMLRLALCASEVYFPVPEVEYV